MLDALLGTLHIDSTCSDSNIGMYVEHKRPALMGGHTPITYLDLLVNMRGSLGNMRDLLVSNLQSAIESGLLSYTDTTRCATKHSQVHVHQVHSWYVLHRNAGY